MTALGTLLAHHFRPGLSDPGAHNYTRPFYNHSLRPHRRQIPATPPLYLPDWAHYPVRINGREAHFLSGNSFEKVWPWTTNAQAQTDANGRLFYHAHRVPILWTPGAGARTLTAKMRHNFTAGPYPRVILYARDDLSLADQIATAAATIDTDQTLVLSFTMPTQAAILIWLECANTAEGKATTWDTLTTT